MEMASVRELHLENESRASARPEPTDTLNVLDGFCGLRAPENVTDDGELAAAATAAVGADVAVADPKLLVAVTLTSRVEPTSALWAVYVEKVAPDIKAQPAEQRSHW